MAGLGNLGFTEVPSGFLRLYVATFILSQPNVYVDTLQLYGS